MNFVLSLILIVAALLLVFLARLASDVRVIRDELIPTMRAALLPGTSQSAWTKPRIRMLESHESTVHEGLAGGAPGRFLVWEWRGGAWSARDVPAGVTPGAPPSYAGAFDGDMAKTWVATKR